MGEENEEVNKKTFRWIFFLCALQKDLKKYSISLYRSQMMEQTRRFMKFHFPFISNLFLPFKPNLGKGDVRMAKLRKKENRQQVEFA